MSWWKSLAALERWSESHPTHVRIFGAAMQYLSKLGPAAKLRLYHEVTVAPRPTSFSNTGAAMSAPACLTPSWNTPAPNPRAPRRRRAAAWV